MGAQQLGREQANVSEHPVFVTVQDENGGTRQVRVGTAYPQGNGFRLELGALTMGPAQAAAARPASRPAASGGGGGGGGAVFPNYGRSKGAPIAGASQSDLEFYANGCRRTLADPGKSRWHEKERELLAAIEAEMARQGMGGGGHDDGGGGGGGGLGDEDIPF